MIKYLVTDLDGTLFHGHGENIFDLTKENIEAIEIAKKHGIHIIPASGRAIPYVLHLYELFDFSSDVWGAGLNGAVVYHNETIQEHGLAIDDVCRMIEIVKPHTDCYYNMQMQDMWEQRTYYSTQAEPYFRYKKESETIKCCSVNELSMEEYIAKEKDIQIGKFSVISDTKEQSSYLESLIRKEFEGKYAITRSSSTFLEVNNLSATKGNFIDTLVQHGFDRDEIAVIGDSFNDTYMFKKTIHSFAMNHGDELVKQEAKYCVDSVAECIRMIIEELN